MIFDKVTNLKKYKGLYDNLDKAIEYIENNDLGKLNEGTNVILEDKIYANVMESDLSDDDYHNYEYHKKFLDLHLDICGEEKVLFASQIKENVMEYQDEDDYGLANSEADCVCTLKENKFVICMLDELHKPCVGKNATIKKIVFKIFVGNDNE